MPKTTRMGKTVPGRVALAAMFQRRPNEWINGLELARVGGAYAWRTRVSDLRRPPYSMRIDNRVRVVRQEDGSPMKVSEYIFHEAPQTESCE